MKFLITGGSGFIGTNFINILLDNGFTSILNLDIAPPLQPEHRKFWVVCDIMNLQHMRSVIASYMPDKIVHFAARTDTASDKLEDYLVNTEGTKNVISCLRSVNSVSSFIFISTQYVYKSILNPLPESSTTYRPHTAYGISKYIGELLVSSANLSTTWTIVRPTNIWGPWNYRYATGLFKIMKNKLYFHPRGVNPVKSYGYVENVCHQILTILELEPSCVNEQVFYVGDPPVPSLFWLNTLSSHITGRPVIIVPLFFLVILARFGDFISLFNLSFPLYSQRLKNMMDNYPVPIDNTIELLGLPKPDLGENIRATLTWLNSHVQS